MRILAEQGGVVGAGSITGLRINYLLAVGRPGWVANQACGSGFAGSVCETGMVAAFDKIRDAVGGQELGGDFEAGAGGVFDSGAGGNID